MGPVLQVVRSKSQDLGLPFLISKNLTGSALSTVEQQLFMYRPCLVQWVTDFPSIVSIPTYVLSTLSQSQVMAPKLLEHLQQKLWLGNSIYDHPSVAKVTQQGSPPLLKVVRGRRHISSSCPSCQYRSTLRFQSQQQMKFQVATGLLFSILTLTVQRGLPPQVGGLWQLMAARSSRRQTNIFIGKLQMVENLRKWSDFAYLQFQLVMKLFGIKWF